MSHDAIGAGYISKVCNCVSEHCDVTGFSGIILPCMRQGWVGLWDESISDMLELGGGRGWW